MAFLSSVVGYVITAVLSALGGWLLKMMHVYVLDKKEQVADETKTAAARQALEDAKTKEELDDAAKNIANNFGK